MSEQQDTNGLITSKKIQSGIAGYIWDSPCLKPIAYNPFLASAVIVIALCTIDYLYGKTFMKGGVAMILQHAALTYVFITAGMTINNMLIKHKYRLKNYKDEQVKSGGIEDIPAGDNDLLSSYVD